MRRGRTIAPPRTSVWSSSATAFSSSPSRGRCSTASPTPPRVVSRRSVRTSSRAQSCALIAKELGLGDCSRPSAHRHLAGRAPAHLAEPERARRTARGRARRALPRTRLRADRAGDRRGVQREDRVCALEPRRLQDRAPGGARALRKSGALHGARGRRAGRTTAGSCAPRMLRARSSASAAVRRRRPQSRRPHARRSTRSASCPSSSEVPDPGRSAARGCPAPGAPGCASASHQGNP